MNGERKERERREKGERKEREKGTLMKEKRGFHKVISKTLECSKRFRRNLYHLILVETHLMLFN